MTLVVQSKGNVCSADTRNVNGDTLHCVGCSPVRSDLKVSPVPFRTNFLGLLKLRGNIDMHRVINQEIADYIFHFHILISS